MGHTIVEPKPSLVPIEIEESWVRELQGLSLRNIELKIKNKKNSKVVYSGQGRDAIYSFWNIRTSCFKW